MRLHSYAPHSIDDVTEEELKNIYSRSMVRRRSPGRAVYDLILASPPHGICPLCAHRIASSIDHYLPKDYFPELSVVPMNLIPCCADCNRIKHSYYPAEAGEQILHPYFHRLGSERWLDADIEYLHAGPVLVYRITAPESWSSDLASCVETHASRLDLFLLYSELGGVEMAEIRHRLNRLLSQSGSETVKAHLIAEAESRQHSNPSSWKTAAYFAMAASNRFCSGDFG